MRALVVVALAGCFAEPGYDGTMYRCDVDPDCPDGFVCDIDVCRLQATPPGMVGFSEATFTMGCNAGGSGGDCVTDAQPQHEVQLSAYALDIHEATEEEFQRCIAAGACSMTIVPITGSTQTAPVRGVTWTNAKAYCTFMKKQLPTEAQWERAARTAFATLFPWGVAGFDCTRANAFPCGMNGVVAIDAMPLGDTVEGLQHMGGNVREWVIDSYSDTFYAQGFSFVDPRNETADSIKVARGGSFRTDVPFLKVWYRDAEDMAHGGTAADGDDLGVRCAKPL